jgi:dihydropteroate synthase
MWTLQLGDRTYDLRTRALVMGILNRTPDSFFDQGRTWSFDAFLRRADEIVAQGADILDVGGVKAAPGDEVTEAEELDRVVPAVAALRARFDVPISTDTWRATVLDEACGAGAVIGNDISGFADPEYLPVAARRGAAVVATHIRLRPRVADPDPHYDDLVPDVERFLLDRAHRAEAAGIPPERIVVDAGLDLGKNRWQSAILQRESERLAGLGYPLLLSASNKRFLGELCGDLAVGERAEVSLASAAYGIAHGCRILRVHHVRETVQVARVVAAILEARDAHELRRTADAGASAPGSASAGAAAAGPKPVGAASAGAAAPGPKPVGPEPAGGSSGARADRPRRTHGVAATSTTVRGAPVVTRGRAAS